MRNAYALLGLMFLVVFAGAYLLIKEAHAPIPEEYPVEYDERSDEEPLTSEESMSLTITSPAFEDGGNIPSKYTCDGADVSPELNISGVPEGAQTLVLLMDDPDAPGGTWAHWALYNIPADTTTIPEGASLGNHGKNSWGNAEYGGPCPPSGAHRYVFRLYAVSGTLNFIQEPTLQDIEEAAKGMSLETATLIGQYERSKNE